MAFGEAGRAVFSGLSTKSLISDSALDPNASWKALQYYAARFFTPVAVLAKVCGTRVSFSASNSGKAAAFGNLEYRIIDSSNTLIHKESIDVDIAEHSAKELFTVDLAEQIEGHECDRYLEYILTEGSHVLCRGTLLFVAPKRFKLKDPEIKYELTGADKRFSLTLSAEAFATGVEIVFDGVDAIISDNYFDLTSSAPVKIGVSLNNPAENLKSLKKALRIRTLYEVGKNK
jgi:beta-mannosidase